MSLIKSSLLVTFYLLFVSVIFGQHWQSLATVSAVGPQRIQLGAIEKLEADLPNFRALYDEGLISRKEMESYEQKHRQLLQQRNSLQSEIVPVKYRQQSKAKQTQRNSATTKNRAYKQQNSVSRPSRYTTRNVVLKSMGNFINSDALSDLKNHYYQTFNTPLPISATGQSSTHDRLGWDHSGRVDIAVSPDSAEGQVIMKFLRERNIGYMGFRASVPGASTGRHIHIGPPSSKK